MCRGISMSQTFQSSNIVLSRDNDVRRNPNIYYFHTHTNTLTFNTNINTNTNTKIKTVTLHTLEYTHHKIRKKDKKHKLPKIKQKNSSIAARQTLQQSGFSSFSSPILQFCFATHLNNFSSPVPPPSNTTKYSNIQQ